MGSSKELSDWQGWGCSQMTGREHIWKSNTYQVAQFGTVEYKPTVVWGETRHELMARCFNCSQLNLRDLMHPGQQHSMVQHSTWHLQWSCLDGSIDLAPHKDQQANELRHCNEGTWQSGSAEEKSKGKFCNRGGKEPNNSVTWENMSHWRLLAAQMLLLRLL